MLEQQSAKRKQMKAEKVKDWIFYFFLVAIPLIQFFICYVGVNINSILLSFKTYTTATDYRWSFDNFERIFTTEWSTVANSLQNSLIAFAARVLVGMTLGLVFSYYIFKKMPASNFFKLVLFLPTIVSQIVMVIVYRQFVDEALPELMGMSGELGLISQGKIDPEGNMLFVVIIVYNIWVGFGTQVLMYLGAMNNISDGALEACQIDGANAVQEFIYIVFPGIFETFMVFITVNLTEFFTNQMALHAFFGVNELGNSKNYTLGYYMWREVGKANNNVTALTYPSALGVLGTVVAIPLIFGIRKVLEKLGPKEI